MDCSSNEILNKENTIRYSLYFMKFLLFFSFYYVVHFFAFQLILSFVFVFLPFHVSFLFLGVVSHIQLSP